jgi:hypothetical protein
MSVRWGITGSKVIKRMANGYRDAECFLQKHHALAFPEKRDDPNFFRQ